ncbi:MAG: methyltransferase domain-containing protein [Pirellulales bacterium]|nr:methyltransferase domain-containing protein [Pirellulales bacterium]
MEDPAAQRRMSLLFSLYEPLFRKAPGSDRSTRQALLLTGSPRPSKIIEFGCGSGAATLVLAASTETAVTAVDIHQSFLADLKRRAARAGFSGRIRTCRADMAAPPFPDGSFNLVWSEGAIYLMGFESGLKRWRRLLRPGGCVAVSEVTWLCTNPPLAAADYWAAGYPAMTTIQSNLATLRSCGFDPLGHFTLPPEDWSENFYRPLEERLRHFRTEHATDPDAQTLADEEEREIELWRNHGDSYGYVFYVGRAC